MTDPFICEIDESAGLRDLPHQTTVFGEVEAVEPPASVLVYCGDKLVHATRDGHQYVCVCGHTLEVVW